MTFFFFLIKLGHQFLGLDSVATNDRILQRNCHVQRGKQLRTHVGLILGDVFTVLFFGLRSHFHRGDHSLCIHNSSFNHLNIGQVLRLAGSIKRGFFKRFVTAVDLLHGAFKILAWATTTTRVSGFILRLGKRNKFILINQTIFI